MVSEKKTAEQNPPYALLENTHKRIESRSRAKGRRGSEGPQFKADQDASIAREKRDAGKRPKSVSYKFRQKKENARSEQNKKKPIRRDNTWPT